MNSAFATKDFASLIAKGPFAVIVADPPWNYYGSPTKWAAAGKFYNLMSDEELQSLPVPKLYHKNTVMFMWATSSSLERSINLLRAWNLYYRGVAFVWLKTTQTGQLIGAQGVRPSITKPLSEFVIAGSTIERGRPLDLFDESIVQTVLAPKTRHSEKPSAVMDRLERMYPQCRKAELFCRSPRPSWYSWGNEVVATTGAQ